jgi:hypothetical protein
MQKFARWFGFAFGLVLALHGLALAFLQSPLIATSNRRGALLYSFAIEAVFGEPAAWILSGLLWFAAGVFVIYYSWGLSGAAAQSRSSRKARRKLR